jgi:hypothetical protein
MERYTNKTLVSQLIGVEESVILDDWLDWATAQVDTLTERTWADVTVVERYDGTDSDELYLDNVPVIAVTKLEYLQDDATNTWLEFDLNYIVLYKDEGRIKLAETINGQETTYFHEGVQNWRVTYEYGVEDIPDEVRLLASLLTAKLYNISLHGQTGTTKSESIGAYSISYGITPIPVDDQIELLIKKLKINYGRGILGL